MKIYITGSSGSGKTTFAKHLSKKHNLTHYNSDYLRYVQVDNERGRKDRDPEEYAVVIEEIVKSDNWIFEGTQSVVQLLETSDTIIWLKVSLLTTLYRQWKRFVTDPQQRKEHGFINNLKLSHHIVSSQFIGKHDPTRFDDSDYVHVQKLEKLLSKYQDKLIINSDWKNIQSI